MPNKFVGHGPYHYATGGEVAKELKFMKDKGAPKSMIKAEKKEHGIPFGNKKAKPFAEGGSIDDDTRARARAWVEKRRAQQDAEGAGDASAAEASPAAVPARRRAPAAAAAAPKPVLEQKTTTVYSNEGKGKAASAAAKPRDTTGFAETAFNAVRSAFGSGSSEPGRAQLAQRAARAESAKRIAATKPDSEETPPVRSAYNRTPMGAPRYAGGGSIDGCARKGKTRGKVV